MPPLDVAAALAPVDGAEPTGPDLGYDPAFVALERAAQGKPEHQIGSTVIPAEEPDWKAVQRQALELGAKTRDLRVAVYLTKALTRTSGWTGLADGVTLLRGLIERYWEDGLHPRLDPDDKNDPTRRINTLSELADPAFLSALRAIPLVVSKQLGPITLRHVEIANGDVPSPPDGGDITMGAIEGSLSEIGPDGLKALDATLAACREGFVAIEAETEVKVPSDMAPNLEKAIALVRKAGSVVKAAIGEAAPAAEGAAAETTGGRRAAALSGEITSRDDVIRALDKICAYYHKFEPSSPIPMFMERSKRLVMMSFVDIVKELVPEAVAQVAILQGPRE
jgi:type VI secretion system protein ImpA